MLGGGTPSGGGGASVRRTASTAIAGVSATPSGQFGGATPGGGATPMRTPMRDALGLNEPYDASGVEGGRRAEKARAAAARGELRAGLGSLPAPANEYAIEMPGAPADDGEGGGVL